MALTPAEKQYNYRQRKKKEFIPITLYLPRDLDKNHRVVIRKIVDDYIERLKG
jgi:hypothetical protein